MALVIFHACVAGLLLVIAVHAGLNRVRMPRLARLPLPARPPRIAVLIPARDEEDGIGACVGQWVRQAYSDYEVIVFDDDSRDATAARAAAAGGARVRVVRGTGLPRGWRGKAHACHRLRELADADLFVFADADVRPAPETLRQVAGAFESLGVDALSALLYHTSPSLAVRVSAAIQNWAPLAFVPLWCRAAWRSPLFATMNGQFIAIRASAYDRSGGFAAVRDSLGEDAQLGRRLAALGFAVALVEGAALLSCRPYVRLRDLWAANVRNLTVAMLSPPLVATIAAALTVLYLGPPALLLTGLVRGQAASAVWTWLPLGEIFVGMVSRVITDGAAGYPRWLALTHPAAIMALVGMSMDALWRTARRGGVEWRGRRYDLHDAV